MSAATDRPAWFKPRSTWPCRPTNARLLDLQRAVARERADAVAAARARFAPEFEVLVAAPAAHRLAAVKLLEAEQAVREAKAAFDAAIGTARDPGEHRRQLREAEERVKDCQLWLRSAATRLAQAENEARGAGARAWADELAARRPALERQQAAAAEAVREVFAHCAGGVMGFAQPDELLHDPAEVPDR